MHPQQPEDMSTGKLLLLTRDVQRDVRFTLIIIKIQLKWMQPHNSLGYTTLMYLCIRFYNKIYVGPTGVRDARSVPRWRGSGGLATAHTTVTHK